MESAHKQTPPAWYTAEQIAEIAAKAKTLVDTKDRKHGDTIYRQCFIGREFCKWFIVNGVSGPGGYGPQNPWDFTKGGGFRGHRKFSGLKIVIFREQ